MRILVVAPGATHSTYDVYKYYVDAMQDTAGLDVSTFDYHNILDWHYDALDYYFPHMEDDSKASIAFSRGSRELLVDVLVNRPDVVHIVSGTALPEFVWKHLTDIRSRLKERFIISLHLTECPYTDELQDSVAKYADVIFLNDKYSLKTFDPGNEKHVYYLPHSYNPKVHRPDYELDDRFYSDVFFTATPFRERGTFLAKVNWENINLKLGGMWNNYMLPEEYLKLERHIFTHNPVKNDVMARYYAGAKVALNIHRTRMDVDGLTPELDNKQGAYSIGPRVFEAVACGSFLLTDFRQEAVDLFGDTIGYFDTPEDLQSQLNIYLNDDELRENKILAAQEKIKGCTFKDRLDNIVLPVLHDVKEQYLTSKE